MYIFLSRLLVRTKIIKIHVTTRSLNHNSLDNLDRHAKDFAVIYKCSPELLRLTRRGIHCYPPVFELRICRFCNCFDYTKVVWIDMPKNLSLSIASCLAVGLLHCLSCITPRAWGEIKGVTDSVIRGECVDDLLLEWKSLERAFVVEIEASE